MRRIALILVAGLALADASVVTLALPAILRELGTSVDGVAAVIGVYTLVLAVAVLPAARLGRADPARWLLWGSVLFGLGALGGALAGSLTVLLGARCVQALGAAALLPAAARQLGAARESRAWVGASVLGTAAGPALGGALAQAAGWRSIFAVGVPVALAGALSASGAAAPVAASEPSPMAPRLELALAALAAALTAVLFLLVLLLVAGLALAPLAGAATVSVLPLAAILAHSAAPPGPGRVAAGCALTAAGTLALAFLPGGSALWTIPPQLLAGAGLGLALPPLSRGPAARALAIRHAGITLALIALGPLVAHDLDRATERAKRRGVALVLDSPLSPERKLAIGPALVTGVDAASPRRGLRRATAAQLAAASPAERPEIARLGARADETLVAGVGEAFRTAFLITGALAALAAALALGRARAVRPRDALGLCAALGVPALYAVLFALLAPTPPPLADPCLPGTAPSAGGIAGVLQSTALSVLNRAACKFGASREELVLALTDPTERRAFIRRHGVDPASVTGALSGLF